MAGCVETIKANEVRKIFGDQISGEFLCLHKEIGSLFWRKKKKKNKKFARKGHELMTLEAMPVTALANAGNEESLIFRVTFFRSKS